MTTSAAAEDGTLQDDDERSQVRRPSAVTVQRKPLNAETLDLGIYDLEK